MAAGVQGNTLRGNLVAGNPPVQVAVDHSSSPGVDIKNQATPGVNAFEDNVCLTSVNAPCPAVAPRANSLLESELQSLGCGTFPPAASCQLTVSQWNYYLIIKINPDAQPLVIGEGSQQMTVQQYLQARVDAGL
jgi:hypothetical protein